MPTTMVPALALTTALGLAPANASQNGGQHAPMMDQMAVGLMMPEVSAERGRRLFADKGGVVCHSINGVGRARLDA